MPYKDKSKNQWIAQVTALQKEMKEDIKAIFGRLDRRGADAPHQEERRVIHGKDE